MERRDVLKFMFLFAAGGAVMAASAEAAPLPPASAPTGPRPADAELQPAVVSQDEVDHLTPEEVRWHRHWHHRRWHRWHWRRWHWRRRHWHRWRWHRWHRRHW